MFHHGLARSMWFHLYHDLDIIPLGMWVRKRFQDWRFRTPNVGRVAGCDRSAAKEQVCQFKSPDVGKLVSHHGYTMEEHHVTTTDGYLLELHRIRNNALVCERDPVLFMHGCMMTSEIWVSHPCRDKCYPLVLSDMGFDVWMGNFRGNRYSNKHCTLGRGSEGFWGFSLDELIVYDVPCLIDHVLAVTGKPAVSYIGFSQGTAVFLAALAHHSKLRSKIRKFVALAATFVPQSPNTRLMTMLIKIPPSLFHHVFGRKMFLSPTLMLARVLPATFFLRMIDFCLWHLFGWTTARISWTDKHVVYFHLYSFTSVKQIAHWLQIISRQAFQMYDESSIGAFNGQDSHGIPMMFFNGTEDSLGNVECLMQHSEAKMVNIPGYEHLDFIWAFDVDQVVLPKLISFLLRPD